MNKTLKTLLLLASSALIFPTAAVPAAPVHINDYLGNWTATAAPYAAGNDADKRLSSYWVPATWRPFSG